MRDAAAAYAQEQQASRLLEVFRGERTDPASVREMGETGVPGATIPEQYGGAGSNYDSYRLVAREVERVDSGQRSMLPSPTSAD